MPLPNTQAGTKVKEQFFDDGKQELQPIVLRCGQFFQNVYGSLLGIEHMGKFFYPLGEKGTLPFAMLFCTRRQ